MKRYNSDSKIFDERSKYKVYCKCGHSLVFYPFEHKTKKLCKNCGYYVYVNKFEKFKDNLLKEIKWTTNMLEEK